MKFKIGDTVYQKISTRHDSFKQGTVLADQVQGKSQGYYLVEWFGYRDWSGKQNTDIAKVDEANLMTKEEATSKKDELREAFKRLEEELRPKMLEATNLLREAQKIADAAGEDLANLDSADELLSVMDKAGWNTSSLSC